MELIVRKTIEGEYTHFTVTCDGKEMSSAFFTEDVGNIYELTANSMASYVFGSLQQENPKNKKVQDT